MSQPCPFFCGLGNLLHYAFPVFSSVRSHWYHTPKSGRNVPIIWVWGRAPIAVRHSSGLPQKPPTDYVVTKPNGQQVTIMKMPVVAGTQTFDPRRSLRDMPPLRPPEEAVCASDFLSDASVGGQAEQTDATHGKLTINRIKVTLHLNITIWVPTNPPKTTVDGHGQISEYYYKNAEAIARRIAEPSIGKVIAISGRDLRNAVSAALQQAGADITNEYNRQMWVETTQARFDLITEHSRKDIPAPDAVAQALKETYR